MNKDKFWLPFDLVLFVVLGTAATFAGVHWAGYSVHNPWDYLGACGWAIVAVGAFSLALRFGRATWKLFRT